MPSSNHKTRICWFHLENSSASHSIAFRETRWEQNPSGLVYEIGEEIEDLGNLAKRDQKASRTVGRYIWLIQEENW